MTHDDNAFLQALADLEQERIARETSEQMAREAELQVTEPRRLPIGAILTGRHHGSWRVVGRGPGKRPEDALLLDRSTWRTDWLSTVLASLPASAAPPNLRIAFDPTASTEENP